jgi:putative phage-type endonuclease
MSNNEESDSDNEGMFIDSLSQDEKEEIYMTITELANDYLEDEIINMTSSSFMSNYYNDVTHILFQQLMDNGICTNDDYDDLYDIVSEVAKNLLDVYNIPLRIEEENCPIVQSKPTQEKIEELRNRPQPVQRTSEWYEFRQSVITASNIGKIFGSDALYNSFIYEKCKNLDMPPITSTYVNTLSPLHWGVKYEPLSVMLYEYRNQTRIGEFGCIRHTIYPFLAASPDGINVDPNSTLFGRMLEIKNIVNREIDGIPSPIYWTQMQIQMECCDLDECDFLETRFKEYESSEEFYADESHTFPGEKGVILSLISNDGSPVYKYMPLDNSLSDINTWRNQEMNSELYKSRQLIYWYLDEYSCSLVKRNRMWFNVAMPKITEAWNIIQKEKVEGFEHRAPKKKIVGTGVHVQINEDGGGSHVIQNMPIANNVCLVKIDEEL